MMRDFFSPGRSTVMAQQAMISTSHPLATSVGLKCLYDGGNAVDAAIAAAAILSLAEPHMTAIGGDCFALVSPKGDTQIHAINGSGRAPSQLDPDALRAMYPDGVIPRNSPHAVTIPGAIDAWYLMHQKWGQASWKSLFEPVISYAKSGIPVHERVALDWSEDAENLNDKDGQRYYLNEGKPYQHGQNFAVPSLAEAFELIASHGRDGFYNGPVAKDIIGKLQNLGGYHRIEDLANIQAEFVAPIHTDYRKRTIWECPPNGQGITALIMARLFERFDPANMAEADFIHLLAEISKQAYGLRDSFLADPDHAQVSVDWLLSDAVIDKVAEKIVMTSASAFAPSDFPTHPDTVYLSVVDKDGMAVSFIYSIFDGFGSGIASPEYGIILQSRGRAFRLDETHPNVIKPNKRPFHTIIPGMLTHGEKLIGPFGVMGGQYQAVGQMAFLINHLDFGMSPQQALDAPRSFAIDGDLQLEKGISKAVADDLATRGHHIVWNDSPIGGGQAIFRDLNTGVLMAGSDPRKDGFAAGY